MNGRNRSSNRGHVFWLLGLSGAGKSTLAGRLAQELRVGGAPVLVLDGDVLRSGLCLGLGFSDLERAENLRRAAEVARMGLNSNLLVVASFITPLAAHRDLVTGIIGRGDLSFIHVNAPIEVCRARDVKGLYRASSRGDKQLMTGVDSAFDFPVQVDLNLLTAQQSLEESVSSLRAFAFNKISEA